MICQKVTVAASRLGRHVGGARAGFGVRRACVCAPGCRQLARRVN